MRVRWLLLVMGTVGVVMAACSGNGPPSGSSPGAEASPGTGASPAAARFLARYVTGDGRVIRHDQGGDLVSEGQAYGMLIAEAAGKPALVRRLWSWTSAHLGRPDGLFAWHADGDGRVLDPQSAGDADVLIAYALLRYGGPDRASLNAAGRRVARAVLANETLTLPGGAPLLLAGPWAKLASPPMVDPSYLMPGVFTALAKLTGDARWSRSASASETLIAELTGRGRLLPPDWAQLSGGRLVPIASPGGGTGVQYGFDAARVPIWFGTACSAAARDLAAGWWRNVLGSDDRSARAALSLTGATREGTGSPLALLAGAAAAKAAGDHEAANSLRARAEELSLRKPTYYGDAWAALGPALLDRSIDPCA